MENDCYRYETHSVAESGTGLFDNAVDETYILMMEGSSRITNVQEQFAKSLPASSYTIQYNKGFKKCNKPAHVVNSTYDIVDAYATVFKHALDKGQHRIMVLEDDFIMDIEKSKAAAPEIVEFLRKEDPDVYNLGPIYAFTWPWGTHKRLIGSMLPCHAVIYSEVYMRKFIDVAAKGWRDADTYVTGARFNAYCYKEPIAYQLFEITENQGNWPVDIKVARWFFESLGLNKNTKKFGTVYPALLTAVWIGIVLMVIVVVALAIVVNKKTGGGVDPK